MVETEKIRATIDSSFDPYELIQPKDDDIDGYDVVVLRADAYLKQRKANIHHLLSGTPLDDLMMISAPGWESGSAYLIYGANTVGKTQTCYTMAVLNQYDVLWIEGGEYTFRPERLIQIAEERGLDPQEVLERVHYIPTINASHMEAIISKLGKMYMRHVYETTDGEKKITRGKNKGKMRKVKVKKIVGREFKKTKLTTGRIGLVILDSLAPNYRLQYQGRGRLNVRQMAILRVLAFIKIISRWFN